MRIVNRAGVALAVTLFCVSLVHAQDLSKYRDFAFGASVASITKQVDRLPAEASVIHQRPAVIQELTWRPPQPYGTGRTAEPVEKILFSFYNGSLYRILVTYSNAATRGLTDQDMIKVVSGKYGTATTPVASVNFPTNPSYRGTEKVIARWEDAQYSLNLFRPSTSNTYALVMFAKQPDVQAGLSIAASMKLEQDEAPQKEAARMKKVNDDLAGERKKNLDAMQP